MSGVLVDSNVLIDVLTQDAKWGEWSEAALQKAARESQLVINPVIYAEISIGWDRVELDRIFSDDVFRREPIPYAAAFLAGKAFAAYRRRGGARRSPLPDFFIGAHAAVAGYRLLTRDAARYQTYFPRVQVVAPDVLS